MRSSANIRARVESRCIALFAGLALAAAADTSRTLEGTLRARDQDLLFGGRDGKTPLKVEVPHVLFVPGQPRERRFVQRSADGKVTGFIWRREGEDILWSRSP